MAVYLECRYAEMIACGSVGLVVLVNLFPFRVG